MDNTQLIRKLFAAARLRRPSDQVPLAFEKRIMARLPLGPLVDTWSQWSRALWHAAAPCVGLALLLAAWAWFAPGPTSPNSDLYQDLESTILAAVDAPATPLD